jgi:hypothetical protein
MPFGQVVIGPPGSGKTTYCAGMQQFMRAAGRKVAVVNLDPANDELPYDAAVDISELVALEEVMEHYRLGPNGGASGGRGGRAGLGSCWGAQPLLSPPSSEQRAAFVAGCARRSSG